MVIQYPEYQPIFADTGAEFPQVYEHIEKVEQKLNIKVVRVKNEKHKSLIEYIKKSKYFPSWKQRYCTRMFKIEPIEDYLKAQGEFKLGIALLYEERLLRGGNHEKYAWYPFIDEEITKKDTIRICKENDLYPEYPPYMSRGGCYNCFFKSKQEIIGMYLADPDLFGKLIELEESVQDQRSYYMFGNLGMSLMNVKKVLDEGKQTAFKFLDNTNYEHTHCGIFCRK